MKKVEVTEKIKDEYELSAYEKIYFINKKQKKLQEKLKNLEKLYLNAIKKYYLKKPFVNDYIFRSYTGKDSKLHCLIDELSDKNSRLYDLDSKKEKEIIENGSVSVKTQKEYDSLAPIIFEEDIIEIKEQIEKEETKIEKIIEKFEKLEKYIKELRKEINRIEKELIVLEKEKNKFLKTIKLVDNLYTKGNNISIKKLKI